jgi:parvulin-like peptidyl-prolyl isomerase
MTQVRTGLLIVVISMLCMATSSAMAADGPRQAPPMPPGAMQQPSAPAEPPLTGIKPDEVMAKYGDQKLTFQEIMFFIPAPTASSAKQLADQWLDLQIMYDAAKARGLTDDPKSKLMAELNGKQIFAKELMNKIAADVNISESQVKEYYEKNKTTDPQLSEPNRFSFMHIKVKTAQEANSVKARLLANEDVDKLAKELSMAPDAKNGGAVKKAPQMMLERQYGKEFADALANGSEGMVIGPIKSQDGFEVVRHEGKLASKAKPFEEVAPMIKRNLEQKGKTEATEKFRETLKKDSAAKSYTSPLLDAPKAVEVKSAKEPNLPVDKTKAAQENAVQKK